MASSLSFDPKEFSELVNLFGLERAWINLLATRISASGTKYAYILEDEVFKGATFLASDLLHGLSIGEIGILYEYCVAHVDSESRRDNGQFFTPDDVAELMVRHALEFPKGKWLDPCSGIGNLSWHLVNAQKDKELFLIQQMVLSDQDELALTIARTLFTLSFQKKHANLYHEIRDCFVKFDFLSCSESPSTFLDCDVSLESIPAHDFVIVNPPYRSMKGENPRFETAKSRDLYAYFLENIIRTSKGFVSVTPQSFTNAAKFTDLRRLLVENFRMLKIYVFDNIPGNIFYGVKFGSTNSNTANSIRAAIMVAGQGRGGQRITSLLRWRTSERKEIFEKLDQFLTTPTLTSEYFPKVSSIFIDLFNEMQIVPTLNSILSPFATGFVLYVPASPRYFISALKNPVSRTSLKKLYFRTEADMNRAYLLLNSSLMYWWWRVRDGGMTLSLETIRSAPLPVFKTNKRIVGKLEQSEKSNLVYKMNAGALHENVKHDMKLIREVTDSILPTYAKRLVLTHENSELVQLSQH